MIATVVISIVLYLLIYIVADSYEKKKRKIRKHEDEGSIVRTITPDSMSRDRMRQYTVNFTKQGKNLKARVDARNRLDAKYQVIIAYDVDVKSILSVV